MSSSSYTKDRVYTIGIWRMAPHLSEEEFIAKSEAMSAGWFDLPVVKRATPSKDFLHHTEWFVGCLREIRWPTSATSRSHNQGRVRDEELDDPDGRTPQRIAVLEQDTGAQVCHGRHYHFIAESKTVIEKPLSSSDSSKVHRFVICETPQGSTADLEQLDEKMESFIARVAQVLIVQKVLKFTVFRQDSSMNAALRPFNASPPKHTFLFQMDFPNQEDLTEVQSDATFAEIRDETMVLFDSTVFTADISTISLRRMYD